MDKLILKVLILFTVVFLLSCTPMTDNTPPSVSITSPTNNSYVSGTISVVVDATDANGISKVEFYVNTTKVSEKTTAPYTFNLNTTSYSDGQYTLKAVAYDRAGNTKEASVSVKIDNTPPSVSITSPTNNSYVSGTISVTADATDANGISKVEFYVNTTKVSEKTTAPYTFNLNTTGYSDGQYTLKAVAYDGSGKSSETSITVKVDNTPPSVSITAPENNADLSGTMSVNVDASDGNGISKVELYLNTSKLGEKTTAPYTFNLNTTNYNDGQYTLKAIACDNAGNKKEASISIRIDNLAPSVSITSPENNAYVSGTIDVNVDASDGNGISKAELYLNTTKLGEKTTAPYTFSLNTTTYSDGQYTLKAIAYDNVGKQNETSLTITIDNKAPSVSITSPTNNELLSGTINVTVDAHDENGISRVELYLNETKIAEKTSMPYTFSVDTVKYPRGKYTLKAVAYDVAANSEIAQVVIYIANEPEGTPKWEFKTSGDVKGCPAIGSDGTIYVGSYDNYLYAINPDGTQKWKFKTGGYVYSSPAIGPDGTIYVGSYDKYLYAINPDGTQKWKFETGFPIYSSPAIGPDGTIYVGSNDDYLYAINPDGTEKWKFETGLGIYYSSPAIGSDGTIYVGSADDHLYAINQNGTQKWKYKTGGDVLSSPAIGADGTIYMVSSDGYLYAINPNGALKWKLKIASYISSYYVSSSPAIGPDGTIYVGSRDHNLYAINPDGTEKWKFSTGSSIYSSPAVGFDGGAIYVGSDDDYLYAINPDGTEKWKVKTGYNVSSSPTIGPDGIVYVGSDDDYLHAIYVKPFVGLADSPWPKFRRNLKNTGNVSDSLQ
ncbi:Outer membrane protein assembly factor BamB, contains PQQ-like beta-propeller repeat [Fervidobacterium changbaicum]|nr:Ig-like domain-containing protein [Fervidobacterium changbaicum]SDH76495.1 Outer membrane protein assembly factor BamB, contains PQQ-like beta-propeller repeat [Fervidobacterium changbaicum]